MKTSPLTVETTKTSPLTVETMKTSPLTVETMKTSTLTVETMETSPVTVVEITDLYPQLLLYYDGIKTCEPLCLQNQVSHGFLYEIP
jgi:hypothetical protein